MVRSWWLLSTAVVLASSGCMEAPNEHAVRTTAVADGGPATHAPDPAPDEGVDEAKEAAERRLKDHLVEIDAEVAKLHEKGAALKEEAKARWNETMADLKRKQKAAREKVDELAASTGDAWKHIEKGARAAWEDVRQALEEAAKEF